MISALENSNLAGMVPTSVEEQDDSSEHLVTRGSAVVRMRHPPLICNVTWHKDA